jgi:sugar/nucleoside kinase (ribokinase family)
MGAEPFHGWIPAALSKITGQPIIEGLGAAKKAGALFGFALNSPNKLWSIWGGGSRAKEALERIMRNVDVLMSNQAARRASDVGATGPGGGGYWFAQLIIHEIPKRSVSAPK